MMFIFAITSILVLQVAYKALAYSSISSNPLVQRQVISTLFSSARPITYRSIEVPIAKRKEPVEVLVDEKNMDVYYELKKLISSGKKAQADALTEMTRKEAAFPVADPTSIELYEEATRLRNILALEPKIFRKPRNPYSNINTFKNIGSEKKPYFIKSYVRERALKPLSEEEKTELDSSFEGFGNVTRLFDVERRMNKAASIPMKLKEFNYSWQSSQWSTYLQHVINAKQVTLPHAIIEYYKTSKADAIGNGKFRRKPGFLGTLPPPEDETLATGTYMLPKRILHPWPAVTEFPEYVRWAPSHPRIPSILLMMARNGQFEESLVIRENEDAIKPSTPKDPIYAGHTMEARDVARIARYLQVGRSFDPDVQIEHPGLLSDDYRNLPFYFPAHGPTMDELDTLPERDEAFWANVLPSYDTTVLAETHIPKRPVPEKDRQEMNEEEQERASRAQAIMNSFENAPWRQEEKRIESILEENVRKKMAFVEEQLGERRFLSPEEMVNSNPAFRKVLQEKRLEAITRFRAEVEASSKEWQKLTSTFREKLISPWVSVERLEELRTMPYQEDKLEDLDLDSTAEDEEQDSDDELMEDFAAIEEQETENTDGASMKTSVPPSSEVFDDFSVQLLEENPWTVAFASEIAAYHHSDDKDTLTYLPKGVSLADWKRLCELSIPRDKLRQLYYMEITARYPRFSPIDIDRWPKGSQERQLAEIAAWRHSIAVPEDNGWTELLEEVFGEELSVSMIPKEGLSVEHQLSGSPSVLPSAERAGPLGESSFRHDSRLWLDWDHDPLPPPVPSSSAPSATLQKTNLLDAYRTNATLRYDLQHGALAALLPPEHNPLYRDNEHHEMSLLLQACDARIEEEISVPLGEDYVRTKRRSKISSERRILDDFETALEEIDENDDNLAYYFDSIRRLVRQTVRRRFPTLFEKSYETLIESVGIAENKIPGATAGYRRLKGSSKDEREKWQEELFNFFDDEITPRANRVILKKFMQATAAGFRTFMEDPPVLDASEIAMPILNLEPAEEMAMVFTNPFAERDLVKRKREQIMENERKMLRVMQAADGMTKSPKEQLEFAMDIAEQIQQTSRRVRAERKVLMAYRVGGDDGGNRGRKGVRARLPGSKVPPPKDPVSLQSIEENGRLGDTVKAVTNEITKSFNLNFDE